MQQLQEKYNESRIRYFKIKRKCKNRITKRNDGN